MDDLGEDFGSQHSIISQRPEKDSSDAEHEMSFTTEGITPSEATEPNGGYSDDESEEDDIRPTQASPLRRGTFKPRVQLKAVQSVEQGDTSMQTVSTNKMPTVAQSPGCQSPVTVIQISSSPLQEVGSTAKKRTTATEGTEKATMMTGEKKKGESETAMDPEVDSEGNDEEGGDEAIMGKGKPATEKMTTAAALEVIKTIRVTYEPQLRGVVCDCSQWLEWSVVQAHVTKHHGITKQQCVDLDEALETLGAIQGVPDVSKVKTIVPTLPIFADAQQCRLCEKVLVAGETIRKHSHGARTGMGWDACIAQRLNRGTHKSYFKIVDTGAPAITDADRIVDSITDAVNDEVLGLDLAERDVQSVHPFLVKVRWPEMVNAVGGPARAVELVKPVGKENDFMRKDVEALLKWGTELIQTTPQTLLRAISVTKSPLGTFDKKESTLENYAVPLFKLLVMLSQTQEVDGLRDVFCAYQALKGLPSARQGLYEVCRYLWTRSWLPSEGNLFPDPTMRALAYSKVTQSGSFADAKNTTPDLAKITHVMQLVLLCSMHEDVRENRQPNLTAAYEALRPFFVEGTDCTWDSIRELQHYATSVALSTPGLPTITHPNRNNPRVLMFKGEEYSFDALGRMLREHEDRLVSHFRAKVCLGLADMLEFPVLANFSDDMSNSAPGYCFTHHARNKLARFKPQLIRAIWGTATVRSKFVRTKDPDTGLPLWNRHEMFQYLRDVREFMLMLLLRCEMVSGGPIRGTELSAMRFANTATRRRNGFWFESHYVLVGQYSKTTASTGHDKQVVHGLDNMTTCLLVYYLTTVLPWVQFCASQIYPAETKGHILQLWRTHLFVDMDHLFTTDTLSTYMRTETAKAMAAPLTVASWRQVGIAFQQSLCRDPIRKLHNVDRYATLAAEQAGHSAEVESKHYALTAEGITGGSGAEIDMYCEISKQYQTALGLVPTGTKLSYTAARHTLLRSLIDDGCVAPFVTPTGVYDDERAEERLATKIADRVYRKLDDKLAALLRGRAESEELEYVLSSSDSDTPHGPRSEKDEISDDEIVCYDPFDAAAADDVPTTDSAEGVQTNFPPKEASEAQLSLLRKLLRDRNATWKSTGQSWAVAAAAQGEFDVMVVMGTGSGKSMVAIITALQSGGLCVLITPLVVVQLDWERRLRKMKVPFVSYRDEDSLQRGIAPNTNLALVSINHYKSPDFVQWIKTYHNNTDSIRRLIYDEYHHTLTGASFRPELRNPYELRVVPVPFLLLSATVPPVHQEMLHEMYGVTEPHFEIRESTERPNLKYSVTRLQNGTSGFEAAVRSVQKDMDTFTNRDRAIVYVNTLADGTRLASALDCDFYHGSLSRDDRDKMHDRWIEGKKRVIVATLSFSAGHDYAHVRSVYYYGTPGGFLDYLQASGRAGRNGKPALCVIFSQGHNTWMAKPGEVDYGGRQAMDEYVHSLTVCRRLMLNRWNDGAERSCKDIKDCELCDVCDIPLPPVIAAPVATMSARVPRHAPKAMRDFVSAARAQQSQSQKPPPSQKQPPPPPQSQKPPPPQSQKPPPPPSQKGGALSGVKRSGGPADGGLAKKPRLMVPDPASSSALSQAFKNGLQRKALRQTPPSWVEQLQEALAVTAGSCILCSSSSHREDAHSRGVMECPQLSQPCSRPGFGTNLDFYLHAWKATLIYREPMGRNPCFKCHVPNGPRDVLHPQFGPGDCAHQDLLASAGFLIYCDPDLLKAATAKFSKQGVWATWDGYVDWQTRRTEHGYPSNLIALFIWYVTNYLT